MDFISEGRGVVVADFDRCIYICLKVREISISDRIGCNIRQTPSIASGLELVFYWCPKVDKRGGGKWC